MAMPTFFCKPYELPPCGLFTVGHLVLFLATALLIGVGLWCSRHMSEKQVRLTVRISTATLWVLELCKILFVLIVTRSSNPNDFIPLYYCSLILYAGLLSSVGQGTVRRIGDVFIATGGLVGGICFLCCPNTSLPRYPTWHFISLHSFLLHGLMVYLGLLLLLRLYRPQLKDLKLCAGLVSVMCVLSLAFNLIWDGAHPMGPEANLMFMSHDFPGTPITVLYRLTGVTFPLFMWLIQAFLPFLGVFGLCRALEAIQRKRRNKI